MPIENNLASDLQLIVPNLHRRYSGVTATNRMVAPKLARMYRAAWLGPHAPDGIARMGFAEFLKLWRRRNSLIWHARRNDEMIVGVLLRLLGWPLKLVFTSAAQRHHTWITRWLIKRMDAIIATDEEQRITVFNPAAEAMFGRPAADALGTSIERFIPARFREVHARHIRPFGDIGATARRRGAPGGSTGRRGSRSRARRA